MEVEIRDTLLHMKNLIEMMLYEDDKYMEFCIDAFADYTDILKQFLRLKQARKDELQAF